MRDKQVVLYELYTVEKMSEYNDYGDMDYILSDREAFNLVSRLQVEILLDIREQNKEIIESNERKLYNYTPTGPG